MLLANHVHSPGFHPHQVREGIWVLVGSIAEFSIGRGFCSTCEALGPSLALHKLDRMRNACDPSIWRMEAGRKGAFWGLIQDRVASKSRLDPCGIYVPTLSWWRYKPFGISCFFPLCPFLTASSSASSSVVIWVPAQARLWLLTTRGQQRPLPVNLGP